jgi:hypothetical protein
MDDRVSPCRALLIISLPTWWTVFCERGEYNCCFFGTWKGVPDRLPSSFSVRQDEWKPASGFALVFCCIDGL